MNGSKWIGGLLLFYCVPLKQRNNPFFLGLKLFYECIHVLVENLENKVLIQIALHWAHMYMCIASQQEASRKSTKICSMISRRVYFRIFFDFVVYRGQNMQNPNPPTRDRCGVSLGVDPTINCCPPHSPN